MSSLTMSWPTVGFLSALVIVNIAFLIGWLRARRTHPLRDRATVGDVAIGLVTDFFDALGIGSFAPTTALFKLRGRPADELIPGTLNVGHNAPAFVETAIFVTAVAVDPLLLTAMVGSATLGAWLGAGIVSRLPRRAIQLFMGFALLTAATFFVIANLGAFPVGGEAMSLLGWRFGVAVGVNFVLGALMSVGVVHGAVGTSGAASAGCLSHHDGDVWSRAAGCQPAFLQNGTFLVGRVAGPDAGWRDWCADRGVCYEAVAIEGAALAGDDCCQLRGGVDVAVCVQGAACW
jgi:hypothetical protein